MKAFTILAVIVLKALLVSSNAINQNYPTMCPKSSPDLNKCTQTYFNLMKSQIVMTGIPEMNLPKLDPLDIKLFLFNYTLNDDIWCTSKLFNIHVTGMKDMKLANYDFSPDTLEGQFSIEIPLLKMKLKYDAAVHMFGNLLEGSGSFKSAQKNIVMDVKMKFKLIDRSGVDYYTFDKLDVNAGYDDMDLSVISNNPDTQVIIDRLLAYYNANRQGVIKMFKPMFSEAVQKYIREVFEYIASRVPAKDILPE